MAENLAAATAARYVSYDSGQLGCNGNHQQVWAHHADNPGNEWSVVLEDDAKPVPGFRDQLAEALNVAPTPIVSLYLGQGRPKQWQLRISNAITEARRQNAHWLTSTDLLHAVGVAIRTALLPSLLHLLGNEPAGQFPIDEAISVWARRYDLPVSYTWPSLVDHADMTSLVDHGNSPQRPRIAWQTGTRDRWNTTQVRM
jgi:hypothetical protein